MARCSVCAYRRIEKVNADLQRGEPHAAVAQRYGLSPQAIGRHVRNGHVPEDTTDITVPADPETDSILGEVRDLLAPLRRSIERAARTANDRSLVAATAECRKTLALIGKLIGELDDRAVTAVQVNLATTPEFRAHLDRVRTFPRFRDDPRLAQEFAAWMAGETVEALPEPLGGPGSPGDAQSGPNYRGKP